MQLVLLFTFLHACTNYISSSSNFLFLSLGYFSDLLLFNLQFIQECFLFQFVGVLLTICHIFSKYFSSFTCLPDFIQSLFCYREIFIFYIIKPINHIIWGYLYILVYDKIIMEILIKKTHSFIFRQILDTFSVSVIVFS